MTSLEMQDLAKILEKSTAIQNTNDTIKELYEASIKKGKAPIDRILVTSFMAGVFVAFGGFLALKLGGSLGNWPDGMKQMVFAAVFGLAVVLVVYMDTELFIGNTLIVTLGALTSISKLKLQSMKFLYYIPKLLIFCWIGNMFGTFFVAFFFVYLAFDYDTVKESSWGIRGVEIAQAKMDKKWSQMIFTSIAGNWLVCCAVFIGARSKDGAGKLFGLWWPIFGFIGCGFEHCVANSFFLWLGSLYGAGPFYLVFYNLGIVTLGNIIGGSFFTGFLMWYSVQRNNPKLRRFLSLKHWILFCLKQSEKENESVDDDIQSLQEDNLVTSEDSEDNELQTLYSVTSTEEELFSHSDAEDSKEEFSKV